MTLSRRRPPERARGSATRFDTTRQRLFIIILGVLVAGLILATAYGVISVANPALALGMFGGAPRAQEVTPRNTDIWIVYPDGSLRFVTLFAPGMAEAASIVFTVAGPYVNSTEDILSAETIGALYTGEETLPGSGNDATRVYTLYSMERDPSLEAYGVDILTTNPPYITPDASDPRIRNISMGAEPQVYYQQVTIAIVFPPGTQVLDIAYEPDSQAAALAPEVLLFPYRRVTINGWIAYYFDGTALEVLNTIRMQYIVGGETPEIDPREIDARR